MRAVDIIVKKRDRQELTAEEIDFFIQGFTREEIPDYQVSAWAMAVLLNGMTPRETSDLTTSLANSGERMDCSLVVPVAVDKHSTGGVGDKTTLVVEPVVAACGLPVGKLSGRGLGFSGGTLDKMESIPGFRTDLTTEEFLNQLRETGLVLTGQTANLAPADGKLYALRDVTGTVQSIPLIASSVMSKKIAAGADAILLDVKVGEGAFMETLEDARKLAELMVSIAVSAGRRCTALLSDMNQPLGQAVGNALEVREAIHTLHGKGPEDFREHCLVAAAHMLVLGQKAGDASEGRSMAEEALDGGGAWERFTALIAAQGGDVSYVEDPDRLPKASRIETIPEPRGGYLRQINARIVGETAVLLGAGREKKGDPIDHAVGIEIFHNVGDRIEEGQPLFAVHANEEGKLQEARQRLLDAHIWSDSPVEPLPLFYDVIQDTDIHSKAP
jgi:pyrimidine-nucleoside phosphorylase